MANLAVVNTNTGAGRLHCPSAPLSLAGSGTDSSSVNLVVLTKLQTQAMSTQDNLALTQLLTHRH
jgi:hypothetical protein